MFIKGNFQVGDTFAHFPELSGPSKSSSPVSHATHYRRRVEASRAKNSSRFRSNAQNIPDLAGV